MPNESKIAAHLHKTIMEMFEPNRNPTSPDTYNMFRENAPNIQTSKADEEPKSNEEPKYYGKQGSGCLFLAKSTGNVLFALRSAKVMEPHTWSGFGGKVDEGENPVDALQRELQEEAGFDQQADYVGVCIYEDSEHGFEYYNYLVIVNEEFNPTLNDETDAFKWTSLDYPPSPLHYGITEALPYYESAIRKALNEKV